MTMTVPIIVRPERGANSIPARAGQIKSDHVVWQSAIQVSKIPADAHALLVNSHRAWQSTHPHRMGTRQEGAAHEAGHAVAGQAEGMGLVKVEIFPAIQEGVSIGWGGAYTPRVRLCNLNFVTPYCILTEAAVILAGSVAGTLFAGVDLFNHPEEIMNAATLAVEYGDMVDLNFEAAFADVVERTARIIHFNQAEALWLADRIAKRKSVSCRDAKVAKAMARVSSIPGFALPPAPEQERELARRLAGAPINLAVTAREIVRLVRQVAR